MLSVVIFWVAGLVIVAAGFLKLQDPDPLHRALAQLKNGSSWTGMLPTLSPTLIRVLGLGEVVVGLWALTSGGRIVSVLMALSYGFFAVVVVAARQSGVESCGCFGQHSGRPTVAHVIINAVLSLGSALAVEGNPRGIWEETADWSVGRGPSVAGVVVLGVIVVALNTRNGATSAR